MQGRIQRLRVSLDVLIYRIRDVRLQRSATDRA